MKLKFTALLLLSTLFPLFLYSQTDTTVKGDSVVWSPDSVHPEAPNFIMDRYQRVLQYHDFYCYLVYPFLFPLEDRRVPLMESEGRNGLFAEGQLAHRFTIHKGKYYSNYILQRSRLTFDASTTLRLTSDNSSPLLPLNNKFGFGLDFLLSPMKNLKKDDAHLMWLTAQLHHYSNGQADSFYIEGPVKRNNYRSGDFSTNYYRVYLQYCRNQKDHNITSAALGFQQEITIGGPFIMSRELDRNYGTYRLLANFQWVNLPKLKVLTPKDRSKRNEKVKLEVQRQTTYRAEFEYILGDLSLFPLSKKHRLGWHNYFTYMPSVVNDIGLMVHTYVGRDYLNIRFDDIVFIAEAGLYAKLR
jgi:hypothetical protein